MIIMANRATEWFMALALVLSLAWFMAEYHRLWRYKGYSLGVLNECLAIGGTCGIAMAFLLGRFGSAALLRLRRPLGVVAVAFVLAHGVLSLFKFQKYAWETKHVASLALGVISFAGVLVMLLFSYPWALRRLGPGRWRTWQRWGYAFLLAGLIHFVLLDKIPAWAKWFRTHDKPAPPGTIIPFTLGVIALLARVMVAMRGNPPVTRTSCE